MKPPLLFRILLRLAGWVFKPLYGVQVEGREHIPATGPVVIAANHVSYWDAVFLQIGCPRQIRWMIDEHYYRLPFLHLLFKAIGNIPVKESGGNRAALDAALEALKAGGVVGIFPEGFLSRTGRMGRAHSGVSTLAARSGAAVVPAYLRGAFATWHKGQWYPRRSPVEVRFGEPMYLRRREDVDRAALQAFAAGLLGEIKGLFGHGRARQVRRDSRQPWDGVDRRGRGA